MLWSLCHGTLPFYFTIKLTNLRNKLSNYVQGFLEVPVTECITSPTYWNIRNSLINAWTHKLHHTYSLQWTIIKMTKLVSTTNVCGKTLYQYLSLVIAFDSARQKHQKQHSNPSSFFHCCHPPQFIKNGSIDLRQSQI